jgi:hypothetical protein
LDSTLHQQAENKQKQINTNEREMIITLIAALLVGVFVVVLVGRNNVKAAEKAVELYEKTQEEIGELKSKIKKPKKAVKKTAPKI